LHSPDEWQAQELGIQEARRTVSRSLHSPDEWQAQELGIQEARRTGSPFVALAKRVRRASTPTPSACPPGL
jgi:hypothetical protein